VPDTRGCPDSFRPSPNRVIADPNLHLDGPIGETPHPQPPLPAATAAPSMGLVRTVPITVSHRLLRGCTLGEWMGRAMSRHIGIPKVASKGRIGAVASS